MNLLAIKNENTFEKVVDRRNTIWKTKAKRKNDIFRVSAIFYPNLHRVNYGGRLSANVFSRCSRVRDLWILIKLRRIIPSLKQ